MRTQECKRVPEVAEGYADQGARRSRPGLSRQMPQHGDASFARSDVRVQQLQLRSCGGIHDPLSPIARGERQDVVKRC